MTQESRAYRPYDDSEPTGKALNDHIAERMGTFADGLQDSFAEFWNFRELMATESDRGCGLMGASYVDNRLEELLKKRLRLNSDLKARMFDYSGPLGSFSARINMAYAIGLLPGNLRTELHVIRDIRNVFAHSAAHLTFDTPEIAKLAARLKAHFREETDPARKKFVTSTVGITAYLNGCIHNATEFEAPADIEIATAGALVREEVDRAVDAIQENIGDSSAT
ncbi:hypothetical protein ACS7SF_25360 (plasmid) [Ralstonia sp. 25C]|uniref:hypothetical protein n=1 Tax=Ralstonia sp. 25C TaxID=3447363 RepID=UPI003F75490C